MTGKPTNLTVTAQDAHGNTVGDYHGTVFLTASEDTGFAVTDPPTCDGRTGIVNCYTFVPGSTGDNGTHTLPMAFKTAGYQVVTATEEYFSWPWWHLTGRSATAPTQQVSARVIQEKIPTTATLLDQPTQGQSQYPVQTPTGSLVYRHTDVAIAGRGGRARW